MQKIYLLALLFVGLSSSGLLPSVLEAQSSDILNRYVTDAYSKSPLLKEALLKLESQRISEDIATRMNKPEVGFGATYSLADGGRRIEFPVGDLLNPVYGTLNRLTQSNNFPTIENVEEQFLPNNFYDARFRVRQPILRAEIALNRSLQGLQSDIQALRVRVVQREIAKEVKIAYFNYLQTDALIVVLEKYLALIDAQRRVQEGLLRNDKIIASALDRNTAERAKLETQLLSARLNRDNARLYFNFLLQRASDEPIRIDSQLVWTEPLAPARADMREELAQLRVAKEASTLLVNLEEARRRPTVGAQFDIGSQGFDFKWGGYVLFGLSLEVPLWSGGRQKLQVQKAQVESMQLDERLRYSERALQLEMEKAQNDFLAARAAWESYPAQLAAARRYYQQTLRRYEEGLAAQIELIDAQTSLYTLEVQQTIAYYGVFVRFAEMERAWAALPLVEIKND
ncbi:MAG: hypothetical protein RL181_618 [Bacteroidota bacterium]